MKKQILLLVLMASSFAPATGQPTPPLPDEAAIETLIARETQAYLNRDAAAQAACWATHTDLSQRVALGNGKLVVAQGTHAALCRGLATCFRDLKNPDPATFIHDEWHIRIRGDAAFVTFRQVLHPPGRPAEESQHTRYLERDATEWKIVHSGVLYAEPPPTAPVAQAIR